MNKIKIVEVKERELKFSDGSRITSEHLSDICVCNYADFEAIDDLAKEWEFTLPLTFEREDGYGFMFGNPPDKMVFVPCYSCQSGWYSSAVDICYRGIYVLQDLECKL